MHLIIDCLVPGQLLVLAYTGPGAGLTMLGSLLALLVLILLALLAPFVLGARMLMKLMRRMSPKTTPAEATASGTAQDLHSNPSISKGQS